MLKMILAVAVLVFAGCASTPHTADGDMKTTPLAEIGNASAAESVPAAPDVAPVQSPAPAAATIDPLPFVGRMVPIPGTSLSVATTEVTVRQFALFMANSGHQIAKGCMSFKKGEWSLDPSIGWGDPGFLQTERHPVTCVSVQDIDAYLKWLNAALKPERPYRLPTLGEWMIASSAGSKADFPWGNRPPAGLANCYRRCDEKFTATSPVGRFKPNQFGLYDVMGNVWEVLSTKSSTATDAFITKGGSWRSQSTTHFNLSAESTISPWIRSNIVGFRIVQETQG